MRARKEHGSPLRKRNRSEVAYAMRVAVLLGKPSRSQRNPREDQRVLLSFPGKRSQGQRDRGLLLHQRDSQNVALSADFHVICWESREAQDYYNYCPRDFLVIGDHMMPNLSESIGSDCIDMNAFSINPNLVVVDRNQASLIQLLENRA